MSIFIEIFIGTLVDVFIGWPNFATATNSLPEYNPTDVTHGLKYDPVKSEYDCDV